MGTGTRRTKACKDKMDTEATREGEDNPKLDQVDRGNTEATREGEDTPKLDQVDQGNTKATREGEDTPKLDQVDRGNNRATREGEDTPELDPRDQGNIEATGEGEDNPKLDQGEMYKDRGAGPGETVQGRTAGGATRSCKEDRGAGLSGNVLGRTAGGATRSCIEDRGAGLNGNVLGRTAGGATRSCIEDRGAGLNGTELGRTAEGATKKLAKDHAKKLAKTHNGRIIKTSARRSARDRARRRDGDCSGGFNGTGAGRIARDLGRVLNETHKGRLRDIEVTRGIKPVTTKKEEKYQAKNEESEAKNQAKTNLGRAENETEAKHQAKTGRGTNYQAKRAAPVTRLEFTYKHLPELHDIKIEGDDSKEELADNETPYGRHVKNLVEAKHQAKTGRGTNYQAKMAAPVTRLEFTYKHLPELHDNTIECDDSKEVLADNETPTGMLVKNLVEAKHQAKTGRGTNYQAKISIGTNYQAKRTEARGAGLIGMVKGSTAEGATRSITEARGAGLSGEVKGSTAEGATRSITEARGAGLSGKVKGSTAEGATRSSIEAQGAELSGVVKGSTAEGATRSITEARGAGLISVVKGGTAELSLRYQAKNEEDKATNQAKTGIGTIQQDEVKNNGKELTKTHTGTLVKNLAEEKETEAKHQELVTRSLHSDSPKSEDKLPANSSSMSHLSAHTESFGQSKSSDSSDRDSDTKDGESNEEDEDRSKEAEGEICGNFQKPLVAGRRRKGSTWQGQVVRVYYLEPARDGCRKRLGNRRAVKKLLGGQTGAGTLSPGNFSVHTRPQGVEGEVVREGKASINTLTGRPARDHAEGDTSIETLNGMLAKAEELAETPTGGSYSYSLVDPRPVEVLDNDNSTSVQGTGTERSLEPIHVVKSNPPYSQHKAKDLKTLTGRLDRDSAEADASIETHTGTPAKDLAEGDASIETHTGTLAKDHTEGDTSTKTLAKKLVANPSQLHKPAHTDTMPCEYLSLETLEEWNGFGFMQCHTFLSHEVARERWRKAHNSSRTTMLYREEVIYTHSYVQNYFESIKGYGKKVTEVKECYTVALATAAANHKKRRKFQQRDQATRLNNASFHTRMVDNLDERIIETCDLSLFCFYSKAVNEKKHSGQGTGQGRKQEPGDDRRPNDRHQRRPDDCRKF